MGIIKFTQAAGDGTWRYAQAGGFPSIDQESVQEIADTLLRLNNGENDRGTI